MNELRFKLKIYLCINIYTYIYIYIYDNHNQEVTNIRHQPLMFHSDECFAIHLLNPFEINKTKSIDSLSINVYLRKRMRKYSHADKYIYTI